jgi:hypothetical protein
MSFKQISGVFGANLGEMAQLQGVVTSTMNQINSDLAKIETKITNTTWTGPDSTKGYDYWTQQKNILVKTIKAIEAAVNKMVKDQASEQERASA